MRPLPSRHLRVTAALGLAAALSACASASATSPSSPSPSVVGGAGTGASGDARAARAGTLLEASGGYTGRIVGTFSCARTGNTTVVSMVPGATSLVVRAVGGKVVESAYLSGGVDFGGPISRPGQGGTVTVTGTSATLANVQVVSRTGRAPMILNGTVTCH